MRKEKQCDWKQGLAVFFRMGQIKIASKNLCRNVVYGIRIHLLRIPPKGQKIVKVNEVNSMMRLLQKESMRRLDDSNSEYQYSM